MGEELIDMAPKSYSTLYILFCCFMAFVMCLKIILCLKIWKDHCCKTTSNVEEPETIPNQENIVKITDMWVSQENEDQKLILNQMNQQMAELRCVAKEVGVDTKQGIKNDLTCRNGTH